MKLHRPRPPIVRAVLPVRSLDEVEPLHTLLGGGVQRYDDTYAWVGPPGVEHWHLRVVDGLDVDANESGLYVHVPEPDTVHTTLVEAGFKPTPVRDEPWAMREFIIIDASGNRIRVGRNL